MFKCVHNIIFIKFAIFFQCTDSLTLTDVNV